MTISVPVLIAGGGPVGLALAVELGVRGIECLLVERGDGSVDVPKMSQLTTRTMEFCRRWDIAEAARSVGWPRELPGDFVYLTSLTGHELLRQPVPSYAERGEVSYSPEGSLQCPQIFFDPVLLRRAKSLPPVTIKHRTQLESFDQTPDAVCATVTDLLSGTTSTVEAQYVVGCDGFDGHVRKALGVQYAGSGMLSYSISIFFSSPELVHLHDKGWARFYRLVDAGGHWADLIAIDGRELYRLTALDLDPDVHPGTFDAEACLLRAAGREFPHEVLSVLPWKRRELIADRYQNGRVFIAGDAAHQSSPTGGLGMNTGVADAVDLGWKLAAVLDGWGGPRLLASYEEERRPVGEASVTISSLVFEDTMSLVSGPEIDEDSPDGERARRRFVETFREKPRVGSDPIGENVKLGYRYNESPIVWPESAPPWALDARFWQTARVGGRAPHAWLSPGHSTLDLFGHGLVLLRFGDESVTGLVAAAEARGVPLRVVDVSRPDIAALYERKLVLVRPDGHVAWRADAIPDDGPGLIDRVRGA